MNIIFDLHGVLFSYQGTQLVPLEYGVVILNLCARQGSHTLYACTNFSRQQVELLMESYQQIFKNFVAIVTPTESGFKKPDPAMFEFITSTHGLSKEETLLIDDQEENIRAAQAYGIQGLLMVHDNSFIHLLNKGGLIKASDMPTP
jgi:FMN phosphatase YigB (HAD superfamily)